MAVHPGRNIAFSALLERINRRCEHSKEYPSKRNGPQPRKFSFDLAFKNTRINTHRLGPNSLSCDARNAGREEEDLPANYALVLHVAYASLFKFLSLRQH